MWPFGSSEEKKEADPIAEGDFSKAVAENAKILAGMKDVANSLRQMQTQDSYEANDAEWLKRLREESKV